MENFLKHLQIGYSKRKYDLDKKKIENFIDEFFRFVFFLELQRCASEKEIEERLNEFKNTFVEILCEVFNNETEAKEQAEFFFKKFPEIYKNLEKDAEFALKNDPAATSVEEITFSYPGFYAIAIYRLAHELQLKKIPVIHRNTTAQEILTDFPEGFDFVITGVGNGGHITGVTEILKKSFPNLISFAVEPKDSPVLSGGNPNPYPLQGIGAGFVRKVLNREILDWIITVEKAEAYDFARKLAEQEGILAGVSTGASLAAIAKKLGDLPKGAKILTFNYDTRERYWSVPDLFEERESELK